MWEILAPIRLGWTVGIILFVLFIRFLQKLHFNRMLVKGLPGPPHSYIWGSLQAMGEIMSKQPKRASPQSLPGVLQETYDLPDYFYLDTFPFGDPIMMIMDPVMMQEITVKTSMPKHRVVHDFMKHIGGPGNLVSSEGWEWKRWRSAFNPGFAVGHLMTLVPVIVDECLTFCEILTQRANENVLFRMEPAATKLTIDIIGRVVMDDCFNSQRGPNELVDSMIQQVKWTPLGARSNPWELIDVRRPIMRRYLTWKMDRYIGRNLEERFASRAGREQSKAVIDLALDTYLKEVKSVSGDGAAVTSLDPEFKTAAISNLKTFIFAGHDTTSSTICYALYYLSKSPKVLTKLREELDEVFGVDSQTVAEQLKQDPRILNKLEYTSAVTREVLRMQPPASTIRAGQKGFFLHDPQTGAALPTEHFMLWPVVVGAHRHARHWPDPHVFRPERHLAGGSSRSSDAWIPFSKGPRNCIGQELALLETKVILALTVPRFDFAPAFDAPALAALRADASGYPGDAAGVQHQRGEEAYQIQMGAAKPREGMPGRVRLRGRVRA